ncbi:hypothetical protein B296_00001024 [Ensete ventricosum]|uniref:RING-type domain-containing protein n=1 Tax=Ensete ventricosum TaxID=4639 RepID=A0A427AYY7_ENSVE|nr:hypothetical protein B296_00001024 [Ensete ventricosum]
MIEPVYWSVLAYRLSVHWYVSVFQRGRKRRRGRDGGGRGGRRKEEEEEAQEGGRGRSIEGEEEEEMRNTYVHDGGVWSLFDLPVGSSSFAVSGSQNLESTSYVHWHIEQLCTKTEQRYHCRNSRSRSCPFCRNSLTRVNSGDLWMFIENRDVVDMEMVSRENIRRLIMYIKKLPEIVSETVSDPYDSHLR